MNKTDLSDVTFTIPVRRDSKDREENLDLQIRYLKHHFDCQIIIGEESSVDYFRKTDPPIANGLADQIIWTESYSQSFHRTKMLNDLARLAQTPFVVNLDTDVFFPVSAYARAVETLRNGSFDFCFPYLGKFMEVPRSYYPDIMNTMDLSIVDLAKCGVNHPNSVGGAIFLNKQKYFEAGGENEKFISWGAEDNERIARWQKLGYRVGRVGDILYHISHFRTQNSDPSNPFFGANTQEYARIVGMSKDELLKYVNGWSWRYI